MITATNRFLFNWIFTNIESLVNEFKNAIKMIGLPPVVAAAS